VLKLIATQSYKIADYYIDTVDELIAIQQKLYEQTRNNKDIPIDCTGSVIVVGLLQYGTHIDEKNKNLSSNVNTKYIHEFQKKGRHVPPTKGQAIRGISLKRTNTLSTDTPFIANTLLSDDLFKSESIFTLHFYGTKSSHPVFIERTPDNRYLAYDRTSNAMLSLRDDTLLKCWISKIHATHTSLNFPDIPVERIMTTPYKDENSDIQLCSFSRTRK
jgi:hypothetical protein